MKKNKGFTLIEIVIATTMMSIIMLSIFTIYFNMVEANKRLELTRILQENSRNITENIAKDIRENGIDFGYYDGINTDNISYPNGNKLLKINDRGYLYCLINKDNICDPDNSCPGNKDCYFGKYYLDNLNSSVHISNERVKINKMRFYISGTGSQDITNSENEGKVTIVFELGIMPGKGLSSDLIKNTKLNVETTISEKIYKQ